MQLARKFAYAFFNVYCDQFTRDDMVHYEQAAQFLRSHRRALFLLGVPRLPESVKWEGLASFAKRFQLPQITENLIKLLLQKKQSFLIADVFLQLIDIYKEHKNIHYMTVKSSCTLSQDMRLVIERFLAARLEGDIIYTYAIDKELIAGLRLQSDKWLWEYSLNKQLRGLTYSWIR